MDEGSNLYAPPKTTDSVFETVLSGRWCKIKNTRPMLCHRAWVSFGSHTFRAYYEPTKQRSLLVIVVAFIIIAWIQALVVMLLLYLLLDIIIQKCSRKMIEFNLKEETWYIDHDSSCCGVRKFKKGFPIFIGARAPSELLEQLQKNYRCREMPIEIKSRLRYRFGVITVWIVAIAIGILFRY